MNTPNPIDFLTTALGLLSSTMVVAHGSTVLVNEGSVATIDPEKHYLIDMADGLLCGELDIVEGRARLVLHPGAEDRWDSVC